MKVCELDAKGFAVDSFSTAGTVKDSVGDSADSLLSEGVFSSDTSGLLLGADNVNLLSRTLLECPGIRPLWAVLDPETEIADGFDVLLTQTFGEGTEAIVAV